MRWGGLSLRLLPVFWETPPTGWERGFLTPKGLYLVKAALLQGMALPAAQIHYKESRGYPESEVVEKSPYSAPAALWSVSPKVLEALRSEY